MSGLEEKLAEIRASLTPKPFRVEFVDALEYLMRLEAAKQDQFDLCNHNNNNAVVDWPKLDYFAHQFKKMIKNKPHLDLLCAQMSKSSIKCDNNNKNNNNDLLLLDTQQRNYANLVNDDGNCAQQADYFSLTGVLVRLAFKTIKFKKSAAASPSVERKVFEFILVLISCLADLSLYEDLRAQVYFYCVFFYLSNH